MLVFQKVIPICVGLVVLAVVGIQEDVHLRLAGALTKAEPSEAALFNEAEEHVLSPVGGAVSIPKNPAAKSFLSTASEDSEWEATEEVATEEVAFIETEEPQPQSSTKAASDICVVAEAMRQEKNQMNVSSYTDGKKVEEFQFPSVGTPHATVAICENNKKKNNKKKHPNGDGADNSLVTKVIAFKAARTGSTFFTDVLVKTLKSTGRNAYDWWEPFSARTCDGTSMDPKKQQYHLRTILSERCEWTPGLKCRPASPQTCKKANGGEQPPVFVVGANPRFFNVEGGLDWNDILNPQSSKVQTATDAETITGVAKTFYLRRTNLVLMAYSKFHHGGCSTWSKKILDKGEFTWEKLLMCVQHYALGDQEVSASVAMQATNAALDGEPYLVVYEDTTSHKQLIQDGLVKHLQLKVEKQETTMLSQSSVHKVHSGGFCDYPDVDCEALMGTLEASGDYPCLKKQLKMIVADPSKSGLAWSVPLKEDGAVSIHGDCHTLGPLTDEHPKRSFSELYSLS